MAFLKNWVRLPGETAPKYILQLGFNPTTLELTPVAHRVVSSADFDSVGTVQIIRQYDIVVQRDSENTSVRLMVQEHPRIPVMTVVTDLYAQKVFKMSAAELLDKLCTKHSWMTSWLDDLKNSKFIPEAASPRRADVAVAKLHREVLAAVTKYGLPITAEDFVFADARYMFFNPITGTAVLKTKLLEKVITEDGVIKHKLEWSEAYLSNGDGKPARRVVGKPTIVDVLTHEQLQAGEFLEEAVRPGYKYLIVVEFKRDFHVANKIHGESILIIRL